MIDQSERTPRYTRDQVRRFIVSPDRRMGLRNRDITITLRALRNHHGFATVLCGCGKDFLTLWQPSVACTCGRSMAGRRSRQFRKVVARVGECPRTVVDHPDGPVSHHSAEFDVPTRSSIAWPPSTDGMRSTDRPVIPVRADGPVPAGRDRGEGELCGDRTPITTRSTRSSEADRPSGALAGGTSTAVSASRCTLMVIQPRLRSARHDHRRQNPVSAYVGTGSDGIGSAAT
jgi:hypothetical protein